LPIADCRLPIADFRLPTADCRLPIRLPTAKKTSMDEPRTKETKQDWKRFLNYQWIVKNFPFFLFLSFLAVIYIYNGHYADKTVRNINTVSKEIDELNYEFKTLKSEVMFRSKQSELSKAVEPFGLKELTTPPVMLVDSASDRE
jgi:hypothetical protein